MPLQSSYKGSSLLIVLDLLDTMSDAASPTQRIVPGAPPPAPLSKSQQKKKRKVAGTKRPDGSDGPDVASPRDAALIDHAPTADSTDPSLLVPPEEVAVSAAASEKAAEIASSIIEPILANSPKKTSAMVELVNKRYRALTKKIVRLLFMSFCQEPYPAGPARRVESRATCPPETRTWSAEHLRLKNMRQLLQYLCTRPSPLCRAIGL